MNDETLRALPKVQLHCHLEGTVRQPTLLDLGRRRGLDLPEEPYRFESFAEFLVAFQTVCKALSDPDAFARIATEYAEDAVRDGVRYAELFVSPSVWSFFHPGIERGACMRAIRDAFDCFRDRIEIALICDLTRNFGPESGLRSVAEIAGWREHGVIGIGLGGDETRFPAGLFFEAYGLARREGLRRVAHAGEAAGAYSVREAVECLGAERIGHGIRAIEDAAVVELLRERGVALEICPTSNRRTGAWASAVPHPLGALDAAGVTVTIDTDDPAMFGAGLLDEYRLVEAGWGEAAMLRFARNAIGAGFAAEVKKMELLAAFDAAARRGDAAGAVERTS